MRNLKFSFIKWNSAYQKLSNVENSLDFYRTSYEDEIPKDELEKHLISLEAWAEYADENKLLYEATILDQLDQPYGLVRFNEGNCGVEFLDEHNRIYMRYCFDQLKAGRLFLYQMWFWEYERNESGRNYESYKCETRYFFTPEGGLTVYKEYKEGGEWFKSEQSAAHPINVENNWEPYPEVGKYDSLVRIERWEEGDFLKGVHIGN